MSTQDLFSKFSVESFKAELNSISDKLTEVSVSGFRSHFCSDCGKKLSKIRFTRCRSCNMKRLGKARRKKK